MGRDQDRDQEGEHHVLVAAEGHHHLRSLVEHAQRRAGPAEDRGQRHDDQDDAGDLGRFDQHLVEIAQRQRAVDHEPDEQAVDHRHHRGFRGREPPGPHAAQDQHRRHQAPDRIAQRAPERRARLILLGEAEAVLARLPEDRHQERHAREDAGDHARREQRRHGRLRHQH